MLLLKRVWIQVSSDRRRFGALCATAILGLLLWARLIIVSNLPKTAVADEADGGSGKAAETTSGKPPAAALAVALDASPSRDPFIVSRAFPRSTLIPPLVEDGHKSGDPTAEDAGQQEAQRLAQIRALVDSLSLDAVMSAGPMAVISGRAYRLGDEIPVVEGERLRFRLTEVRQRSVMLEYEGRPYELKMATPRPN
jgi:hypothetical protein